MRFFSVLLCFAPAQNHLPVPLSQSRTILQPKALPLPLPGGTDRQVRLDVQVTDHSGRPIRGLQLQDFTLLDNKQRLNPSFQAVDTEAASAVDPPLEIVLVIDAINTSYQLIASARKDVKTFLLQNDGKMAQPMSLIFISGQGTKIQNISSRDGKAVAALFDQYAAPIQASNLVASFGAEDRFNMSLEALGALTQYESTRPGRKLMIWLSSGWPFFSGSNLEFTPKDWQQLFDSVVALSRALRQSRITLYDIDPAGVANAGGTRVSYYQDFLKGVTSPSRMQPGSLSLQVLAIQSGGRVFSATNNLSAAIATCAADADAFYTLSYDMPPASHASEYHTLTVTVDKPHVTARTRSGYYAQP
jgi:VWFA-related protein